MNRLCLLFLLTLYNPFVFGQDKPSVRMGSRHMMMLQADKSYVWGTYYFAVINDSQEPQQFQAVVSMPKEASEFRPQEGLQPQDLRQNEQGDVVVDKRFPPGTHLMALGFQVPFQKEPRLSVIMATDVPEFSVSTPLSSQLTLSSSQLTEGVPSMLQGGQFQGLISTGPLGKGDKIEISVHGIPEGRDIFWALGFLAFGLLLFLSFLLAYRTHLPRSE